MTCEFKGHTDSTENPALEGKWVTHPIHLGPLF